MKMTLASSQNASCICGACKIEVAAVPASRFICHCTVCQAYTGSSLSDVTIIRARHVRVKGAKIIDFRKYRSPPNIDRGTCRQCGTPVIELGGYGPAKIAFIPTENFETSKALPAVSMHIFYHRRRNNVADDLPKYSGYLRSELAVLRLMGGLFMP